MFTSLVGQSYRLIYFCIVLFFGLLSKLHNILVNKLFTSRIHLLNGYPSQPKGKVNLLLWRTLHMQSIAMRL